MARVISGITMSLDGYVTGPGDRLGAGLGEGGERLHEWVFGGPWTYDGPRGTPAPVDQEYLESVFADGGGWIVGRTMHDVVDGWGDDPGFGVPVFVVTHRPRDTVVKGDTIFEFVTGVMNIQYWYAFGFNFVVAHYYGAIVFVAALAVHVTVKTPVALRAFRHEIDGIEWLDGDGTCQPDPCGLFQVVCAPTRNDEREEGMLLMVGVDDFDTGGTLL